MEEQISRNILHYPKEEMQTRINSVVTRFQQNYWKIFDCEQNANILSKYILTYILFPST